MIKADKKKLVKALLEEFGKVNNYYFADFAGIKAGQITRLRRGLREQNARMKVVKNRLLRRVLSELNVELPDLQTTRGSTAVLYSLDDLLAPVRKVSEFIEEEIPIRFKGAFLEGRFFTVEEVERLAKIPSRETLLSQLVGLFEGVKSTLVSVLVAKLEELVLVLSSLRAQKEE